MRALILRCLLPIVLLVTGCAGRTADRDRIAHEYLVVFSVTRASDHVGLASVSLPVNLGSEAKLKIATAAPGENHPVVPAVLARLNRIGQTGAFELVTRVSVREAIRNKKGKLKLNKRFIGGLAPTRLGEEQVVSAEGDPVHVEARLERR